MRRADPGPYRPLATFALLDGDEGLDAQHPAGHGDGGRQTAALAQILQVVDGGDEVQVLLGVFEGGGDLDGRLAFIPQVCGQAYSRPSPRQTLVLSTKRTLSTLARSAASFAH